VRKSRTAVSPLFFVFSHSASLSLARSFETFHPKNLPRSGLYRGRFQPGRRPQLLPPGRDGKDGAPPQRQRQLDGGRVHARDGGLGRRARAERRRDLPVGRSHPHDADLLRRDGRDRSVSGCFSFLCFEKKSFSMNDRASLKKKKRQQQTKIHSTGSPGRAVRSLSSTFRRTRSSSTRSRRSSEIERERERRKGCLFVFITFEKSVRFSAAGAPAPALSSSREETTRSSTKKTLCCRFLTLSLSVLNRQRGIVFNAAVIEPSDKGKKEKLFSDFV